MFKNGEMEMEMEMVTEMKSRVSHYLDYWIS